MPTQNAVILTPIDVQNLLHDDSSDSRAAVLDKISVHYNDDKFAGRERDIAEQIFRMLMKDVALRVRETLADRIKDNPAVPRDIVLSLANDVDTVALPVLVRSTVLSDADLVNIVEKSHDMGKLLAISKRETVSTRVSDALVETRYAQVMTSLLTNEGATISDRSLEKIAEDFQHDAGVIESLMQQPKLPIAVVERIIGQASEAVAAELRSKYKLNESDAKHDSGAAREHFMLRLLEGHLSAEDTRVLVAQMAVEDRLTPSIVMTALCRGQLLFFTCALAQFSGIPLVNAMRLVADRGELGFHGIYQKSGLPESMQDAIRLLLRAVQDMEGDSSIPGSMLYANRLAERVIMAGEHHQVEYLPYFIALIRQNAQRP
ncbi:MAG: DUF2336 domain-containing protein [Pseudomonadota bacterium]